jgi:hypothetical protein
VKLWATEAARLGRWDAFDYAAIDQVDLLLLAFVVSYQLVRYHAQ